VRSRSEDIAGASEFKNLKLTIDEAEEDRT